MLESTALRGSKGSLHATNEGSQIRNWTCGCKPGILGPPLSPIPAMLRSTVERIASGQPVSWKLSQQQNLTTLQMKWTTITGLPSNRDDPFPPALLTAVSSLNSVPDSWSLEQDGLTLSCSLTWSTFADQPASCTPQPRPHTNLNDSGYSSPMNLAPSPSFSCATPSLSSLSRKLFPQAISSPSLPFATAKLKTSKPTLTSVADNNRISLASQASQTPIKIFTDAETSPDATAVCNSSSQTPHLPPQNASTQVPSTPSSTCEATSQTFPSTMPAVLADAKSHLKPGKNNKKDRNHKIPNPPASPEVLPLKPTMTDASTMYNPRDLPYKTCRLCQTIVMNQTDPLAHLYECSSLPPRLRDLRSKLMKDLTNLTQLPPEIIHALVQVYLAFDPDLTSDESTHYRPSLKKSFLPPTFVRTSSSKLMTLPGN